MDILRLGEVVDPNKICGDAQKVIRSRRNLMLLEKNGQPLDSTQIDELREIAKKDRQDHANLRGQHIGFYVLADTLNEVSKRLRR